MERYTFEVDHDQECFKILDTVDRQTTDDFDEATLIAHVFEELYAKHIVWLLNERPIQST